MSQGQSPRLLGVVRQLTSQKREDQSERRSPPTTPRANNLNQHPPIQIGIQELEPVEFPDDEKVEERREAPPPAARVGSAWARYKGLPFLGQRPGTRSRRDSSADLKRPLNDETQRSGLDPVMSDFWKRYDRLAETYDEKMAANLNAALFSAINTTFISVTMSSLSPDPSDRTNALLQLLVLRADNSSITPADLSPPFSPAPSSIAANCLLYASLCFSLLASMGAMVGKEWLQSFERDGQTGPLDEQGRRRQQKLIGVQEWRMITMLSFLPNLLLFSVTLFFSGLIVYIYPLNKAIAVVLTVSLGLGNTVWCGTILAGAITPLCPYQSAAARALRWIGQWVSGVWKDLRVRLSKKKRGRRPSLSGDASSQTAIKSEETNEEDIIDIKAAHWLFETTSNRDDQLSAIQVFQKSSSLTGSWVFQDKDSWRRFVVFIRDAFDIFHRHPSKESRRLAEQSGMVLVSLLPPYARDDVKWRVVASLVPIRITGLGSYLLEALVSAARNRRHPNTFKEESELIFQGAFLRALAATHDEPVEVYGWPELKAFITKSSTTSHWFGTAGVELTSVILLKEFGKLCQDLELDDEDAIRAERQDFSNQTGEISAKGVMFGFASVVQALQATQDLRRSRPEITQICTVYLQESRKLQAGELINASQRSLLLKCIETLILSFDRPSSTDVPEARLVQLSEEALRTLKYLHSHSSAESELLADETPPLPACWRALEQVVPPINNRNRADALHSPRSTLILETLEWLSRTLRMQPQMFGLENHPRITTFIAVGLTAPIPDIQARWIRLFSTNRQMWLISSPSSLDTLWREAGVGAKLVEIVRRPEIWDEDCSVLSVLEAATSQSSTWSVDLVKSNFPSGAAGSIVIIHRNKERQRVMGRILGIVLRVWSHTRRTMKDKWATQDILPMIGPSSAYLAYALDDPSKKTSSTSSDVLRLTQLIQCLQEHLPSSTLAPYINSVAVRTLLRKIRGRVSPTMNSDLREALKILLQLPVRWQDPPYRPPKRSPPCSRDVFRQDWVV
ncbi:hypothetical protein FRB90_006668 [Tulasnella sp. 427]|nr:hypothetical protein FRB90_006668 [Tulasnella sp. 427]